MKLTTIAVILGAGFLTWQFMNDGKKAKEGGTKTTTKANKPPSIYWNSGVPVSAPKDPQSFVNKVDWFQAKETMPATQILFPSL